jgi:23S rRNA-/tRNA-specific pseudouridylate synthase
MFRLGRTAVLRGAGLQGRNDLRIEVSHQKLQHAINDSIVSQRVTMSLKLLHISEHEIVLRKPAGLLSEAPRTSTADNVVNLLRAEGFGDVRLVHRLDKPASGLMLVARTVEATAYYGAEIAARRWHKVYVAKVAYQKYAQSLVGDHRAYLKTEGKHATVVRSGGKPSFLTIAHVAQTDRDDEAFAVVRLHTGRFHQIRVMLANLGAPLVGDALYGGPETRPMYLEHVLLGARPFGASYLHVWQSPADDDRPQWPASLADAVAAEVVRISAP